MSDLPHIAIDVQTEPKSRGLIFLWSISKIPVCYAISRQSGSWKSPVALIMDCVNHDRSEPGAYRRRFGLCRGSYRLLMPNTPFSPTSVTSRAHVANFSR